MARRGTTPTTDLPHVRVGQATKEMIRIYAACLNVTEGELVGRLIDRTNATLTRAGATVRVRGGKL